GQVGAGEMDSYLKIVSRSLDHKKVNDLFGIYGGMKVGLSFEKGFTRGIYRNSNKISFLGKGLAREDAGISVIFGPSSFQVNRPLQENGGANPFILPAYTDGYAFSYDF